MGSIEKGGVDAFPEIDEATSSESGLLPGVEVTPVDEQPKGTQRIYYPHYKNNWQLRLPRLDYVLDDSEEVPL